MKRDLLAELKQIKERAGFGFEEYYMTLLYRTKDLYSEADNDKEHLKYLPIACIGCFESIFRSVYKTLIDFGPPYSDNAEKIRKDSFGYDIVKAFHNKTITLGEFIAFAIPCNKLEDINSAISKLADIDFLDLLTKYNKRSIFDHVNEITDAYQRDSIKIIANINRTFELRHIFNHEYGAHIKVSAQEIFDCYESCLLFLKHSSNVIWHLIYPNAPETQTEMNVLASQQFQESEERLVKLVESIRKRLAADQERLKFFDKAFEHWQQMREISGNLYYANGAEQGTIFPVLRFARLTTLNDERRHSLSNEFPDVEVE